VSVHAQLEAAKLKISDDADVIIIGLGSEDATVLSTLVDTELYSVLATIVESAPKGSSWHCFRCLHDWVSRKDGLPKRCGNMKCQTPYWASKKERV
jgi:hypothetical protein